MRIVNRPGQWVYIGCIEKSMPNISTNLDCPQAIMLKHRFD